MNVLIVKARVRPDKVAAYEAIWRELQAMVKANEPDVYLYEVCKDPKTPYTYRIVEAYKDQATQEAHINTEYHRAKKAIIVECLVGGSYEVETFETI